MIALSRRPLLVAALAVGAMTLAACAAGAPPLHTAAARQPPPSDPTDARRQLAYFRQQIARERRALGLVEPGLARKSATDASVGESNGGPSVTPLTPSAASEPPRARRSARPARAEALDGATAGPRPASAPPARHAADGGATYRRAPTCPLPCRRAQAICHAARRICSLADYLGEPDARQSCSRARQDCRDARDATRDQCSACPAQPA